MEPVEEREKSLRQWRLKKMVNVGWDTAGKPVVVTKLFLNNEINVQAIQEIG